MAIVEDVMARFDTNQDKQFDFDEFCEAFNTMIDQLNELHASIRKRAMDASSLASMGMSEVSVRRGRSAACVCPDAC